VLLLEELTESARAAAPGTATATGTGRTEAAGLALSARMGSMR
jgi:hypothetical protein